MFYIRLFRQGLSHKSAKASNSLALLDRGSRSLTKRKKKALIHVFLLFPNLTLKHFELQGSRFIYSHYLHKINIGRKVYLQHINDSISNYSTGCKMCMVVKVAKAF